MREVPPDSIWWNGRIVPWADAVVHVTAETALRGTNVFEGLRAYWQEGHERFAVVAPGEHLRRLAKSARSLMLPAGDMISVLERGILEILGALGYREHVYLRPTVYLNHGAYTAPDEELELGMFISGRPAPCREERPATCATSTWRRISDASLPSSAKVGAAYTAFRLARIEAAGAGCDEAILLNERGAVAETGGASIFVVSGTRVITPPVSDGILSSITRKIAMEILAERFGTVVAEESLCRSQLYAADEVFLCGTLDEIRAVAAIDGRQLPLPAMGVAESLRRYYLDACEGRGDQGKVWWLTYFTPPPAAATPGRGSQS